MTQLRVGPLVRATNATSAIIWTEWTHPCEVVLQATPDGLSQEQEADAVSVCSRTVTVGERHYAALQLTGLQPSTWYGYRIVPTLGEAELLPASAKDIPVECFRTLDLPEPGNSLRLAYGSCRKLSTLEPDALSAFGSWLLRSMNERETVWPRLLLLVGDQIYADGRIGRRKGSQRRGAQSFAEFAALYEETWTSDAGIRQVLAVLPTYMIFDDHEVTNAWNVSPTWRARALQYGREQTLVDGLVAYWVYQGWGNLCNQNPDSHALLAIMQEAEQSGEDALEALRACIRREVYEETSIRWYYEISTVPSIFVADVRADRPAVFNGASAIDAPARIMSQEQMEELRDWIQEHASSTTLLISSVPVILPPLIGLAEYLMGVRPFQRAPLRWLGHFLARIQQRISLHTSFDHWPVFSATWRELVKVLGTRSKDIVVLSGDVHFSYAAEACRMSFHSRSRGALYQLVCSPFSNKLGRVDRLLILGQSWLKRIIYGGLDVRMLRLFWTGGTKRVPHDLLMQNTVALVTFRPQASMNSSEGGYCVRQVYLGVKDGMMDEVASVLAQE